MTRPTNTSSLRLSADNQLLIFLGLTVLFNCSLLLFRNLHLTGQWLEVRHYRDLWGSGGEVSFFFLLWNLWLAMIPYLLSRLLQPGR